MNSPREFEAETVNAYTQLEGHAPTDHSRLLAILHRHNLPWLAPRNAADQFAGLPKYRKTIISGDAFKPTHLDGIVTTPLFYRLAFIKQLSTVSLATHLDANHTRLSHAMGTAEVATRMLERISAWGFTEAAKDIPALYKKACLFYCFIHDVFHGPMGHSLDIMRDVFGVGLSDKLDDAIFGVALREAIADNGGPVANQLRYAASCVAPEEPNELLRTVALLADQHRLKREEPNYYFLRDIIDSVIDADRIDYLMRDAPLLAGNECKDYAELVDTSRVVPEGKLGRLAFSMSVERIATAALSLRRELYTEYYEAPIKLIVDDMLCHGVFYVLRDCNLVTGYAKADEEDLRKAVVRQILLLTDGDFLPALAEFKAAPRCYELFQRVHQRRYFVPVLQRGIRFSEVSKTLDLVKGWTAELSKTINDLKQDRGKRHYADATMPGDEELLQQATERFLTSQNTGADTRELLLTFAFQTIMKGSFLDRQRFEQAVWANFCRRDEEGKLRATYLAKEYGGFGELSRELAILNTFPPLHVSTSSYFDVRSKEDLMQYTKEGTPTRGGVLFYEERDQGLPNVYRGATETEIEENRQAFPLILAVPSTLAALAATPIRESFLDELASCRWIVGRLVGGYNLE